jgi:hypothetical protein
VFRPETARRCVSAFKATGHSTNVDRASAKVVARCRFSITQELPMFSEICKAIYRDLDASADLYWVVRNRIDGITDPHHRVGKEVALDSVRPRFTKTILQFLYFLKHHPTSPTHIRYLAKLTGYDQAEIAACYKAYGGDRFPKPFVFAYMKAISELPEYKEFFPGKTTLTHFVMAMCVIQILKVEKKGNRREEDIVITSELCRLVERWADRMMPIEAKRKTA